MHALLLVALTLGHAPAVEPPRLRVVTYNILAGDRGLKGIIDTLTASKADLIGLQEVDRLTRRSGKANQPAKLAKALGMNVFYAPFFPWQGGEFGVALLSKHPIIKAKAVKVKGSRLSQLDAVVRTPSGDVHVIVVHFTVTFPFRDKKETDACDAARLAEAKTAYALATASDLPVLVMGDMNDDSGSPPYEVFTKSLQDSCDVKGGGLAKTWNSALPITRIDYIWASKQFTVQSCDTLTGQASDHLPVLAELSLAAP
ncbi:MAG: endonuclease/exonuclease/phosphatase family protein [Archangium sp.]|nr:endonuclease/exonuclease/phosphatase family protein [Archangium sp.]